jgi:hypothetical protein
MITINITEEVTTQEDMSMLLEHIAGLIRSGFTSGREPDWFLKGEEEYLDLNGEVLEVGDEVEVPYPDDTDIHSQEFNGVIDSFRGEYVVVVDSDDEYFDIEPNRLIKIQ